jgi:hypothetical protein
MTSPAGFHGFMTKKLARRPDRILDGISRRRFYNPMWGAFGDRTPGPAGSYYWKASNEENTHWAMLDQVLIRPGLIERLEGVRILDHDGTHPLVGENGIPNRDKYSDHLPLVFSIEL